MDFFDLSSIDGSQSSICGCLEPPGREILILTIDVGGGKTAELIIKDNDAPKVLAKDFCFKHNLNLEAEQVLLDLINQNIRAKPKIEVSLLADQPTKPEEHSKYFDSFKSKAKSDRPTSAAKPEKSLEVNQSKASGKINTGHRLYNMGIIQKEQHEKKVSEMRAKMQKEQMKETTFKPRITPERKMPRLQLLHQEPPSAPIDRCHLLFNKAQRTVPQSAKTPVSSNSQKVLDSRKKLQHYLEQREQQAKREVNVYRSKSPAQISRERLKKASRSQSHEFKAKLSNEQTEKIIKRIKAIRFTQLFECLNPNENRIIDKKTVLKAKLPEKILQILIPFFQELQLIDHGLTLEQFCRVMELYIKELTPEERNLILQLGKKRSSSKCSKNQTYNTESNDLWSPRHEEKLLSFEQFADFN